MKLFYSIVCVLAFIPMSLTAQKIGEDHIRAIELMKNKKWNEAHNILQGVMDQIAANVGFAAHANYGNIHYNKGYCELQIAKAAKKVEKKKNYFQLASESMKECFEMHMKFNELNSKSLLYRAQAEQGLGNMELAIELNQLFMSAQRP